MARRIQQIECAIFVVECHDGGGDGNAPLPLHLQPVRVGAPGGALRFHRAGKLDGTAE